MTNDIIQIDRRNLLVKPSVYLKDISQLPPHLKFSDFLKLRDYIPIHWQNKNKISEKYQKIVNRDILFCDYAFETAGRCGDLTNFCFNNYEGQVLNLYTKKRNKFVQIPVSSELYSDTLNYMRRFKIKEDERLFPFTVQRAWQIIEQYADGIGFPRVIKTWQSGKEVNSTLRPHLFRHGCAIHLFNMGVHISIISARLGHSNVQITMNMYLKATPEMQNSATQNIRFR